MAYHDFFLFSRLVQENRSPSQTLLRLSDWFLRPSVIEQANNMDALTRGLADQPEQARDPFYDHEVKNIINIY